MNKILFDGTAIQQAPNVKFHGGSEYAKFILNELIRRGYSFDIVFNSALEIPNDIRNLVVESNIKVISLKDKREIYNLIKNSKYSLFYSALPYEYFDYNLSTPFLGVVHGIRNIEIPWEKNKHRFIKSPLKRVIGTFISKLPRIWEFIRKRNVKKIDSLISNPNFKFITVSEHSKYSILNYFPKLIPDNIKVFYSPINFPKFSELPSEDGNYFLIISGNRFEKNALICVKAFDDLINKGLLQDKYLYITGVEDTRPFGKIKNKDRIKFFPYLPKDKLDSLYQNCFCFLYPSLNEGFGYPPLVAMSLGKPVIASSSTSIPEVCGDAALYFSPDNIDDLKSRLLRINDDAILRKELIEAGYRRVDYIKNIQEQGIDEYINLITSV